MESITPSQLVSLWSGEKKFVVINGKRFRCCVANNEYQFKYGDDVFSLPAGAFNQESEEFLPTLAKIVSLVFGL